MSCETGFGPDTVVLDTNVASGLFKRRLPSDVLAKIYSRHHALSFISVGEMTQWTNLRGWGEDRTEELALYLDRTPIVVGDEGVGRVWGRIVSSAVRKGRTPGINDSWIAATCLSYGLPLVTLNTKDFQYFADHHGLRLL